MRRSGASGAAIAGLAVGIIIGSVITYALASALFEGVITNLRASTSKATSTTTTTVFTSERASTTTATTQGSGATTTVTTTLTVSARGSAASMVYVSLTPGASLNSSSKGYSPATVAVVLGVNNTVIWANNDKTDHTVTPSSVPAGATWSLGSGDLKPGQVYVHTFTAPGTYTYACAYHSWMFGTVVVKG